MLVSRVLVVYKEHIGDIRKGDDPIYRAGIETQMLRMDM